MTTMTIQEGEPPADKKDWLTLISVGAQRPEGCEVSSSLICDSLRRWFHLSRLLCGMWKRRSQISGLVTMTEWAAAVKLSPPCCSPSACCFICVQSWEWAAHKRQRCGPGRHRFTNHRCLCLYWPLLLLVLCFQPCGSHFSCQNAVHSSLSRLSTLRLECAPVVRLAENASTQLGPA